MPPPRCVFSIHIDAGISLHIDPNQGAPLRKVFFMDPTMAEAFTPVFPLNRHLRSHANGRGLGFNVDSWMMLDVLYCPSNCSARSRCLLAMFAKSNRSLHTVQASIFAMAVLPFASLRFCYLVELQSISPTKNSSCFAALSSGMKVSMQHLGIQKLVA